MAHVLEVNKVADMVADMEVDKVADMVADMEVDKVADMEVEFIIFQCGTIIDKILNIHR